MLLKQIRSLLSNNTLKAIRLFALLLLFKNSTAQNLIQNPSFEHSTNYNCQGSFINYDGSSPNFGDQMLDNWNSIASSDYYHMTCSASSYGTPINRPGVAIPVNGVAYSGIIAYSKPYESKEYIFQHLTTPLISGKSYYVSFFVSRVERFTMAIKNIGAYFTAIQPIDGSSQYISATPQVENQSDFLTDTTGWTMIEGYFTAQGGEEYMIIGNFNSNADTDTLYVGTNNPLPSNPDGAYYYIDSVSLHDSLTLPTGLNELKNKPKFNLYPNPTNGNFVLQYDLGKYTSADLVIYDVTGKVVFKTNLVNSEKQMDMNHHKFDNGIYYYTIKTNKEILVTNKFVIIK